MLHSHATGEYITGKVLWADLKGMDFGFNKQ